MKKMYMIYICIFLVLFSSLFSCPNNGPKPQPIQEHTDPQPIQEHTVTFNVWDSVNNKYIENVKTVEDGTEFGSIQKPSINTYVKSKDGTYTWAGWVEMPKATDNNILITEGTEVSDSQKITESKTYYSKYLVELYQVKFNVWENDELGWQYKEYETIVEKGKTFSNIIKPATPSFTKDDLEYIFDGWVEVENVDNKITLNGTNISKASVLTDGTTASNSSIIDEPKTYFAKYRCRCILKFYDWDFVQNKYVEKTTKTVDLGNIYVTFGSIKPSVDTKVDKNKNVYIFLDWTETPPSSIRTMIKDIDIIDKDQTIFTESKSYYAAYAEYNPDNCLVFTAVDDTFISFNLLGYEHLPNPISLMYMVEGVSNFQNYTWDGYTSVKWGEVGGKIIYLKKGEVVLFKGNNTSFSKDDKAYINFRSTGKVEASGNIMSLLGGKTELPTEGACFFGLFKNCKNLVTAPELPATKLTTSCYSQMFYDCDLLTTAPVLPATTLAPSCYNQMFAECSSLTTMPKLPATNLKGADSCYYKMFYNCDALVNLPYALPATTLAPWCYNQMFAYCTSLERAPNLPATTLAVYCYYGMFQGCNKLTKVHYTLPAINLEMGCYESMFNGCSSLRQAPDLPATKLSPSCYMRMFADCTSLITAPDLPARILANYCYFEMFLGCNKLMSVPSILPATNLEKDCYESMFNGCTSLILAPDLPARTLTESCYMRMFKNCTSLLTPPALPATTLAESCYEEMFSGCTSLNIYNSNDHKLSADILPKFCYRLMFKGCTSLTKSPIIAGKTIPDNSQYALAFMFHGCSKLKTIEIYTSWTLERSNFEGWVYGVSNTGTLYHSGTGKWGGSNVARGPNGLPTGWNAYLAVSPIGGGIFYR